MTENDQTTPVDEKTLKAHLAMVATRDLIAFELTTALRYLIRATGGGTAAGRTLSKGTFHLRHFMLLVQAQTNQDFDFYDVCGDAVDALTVTPTDYEDSSEVYAAKCGMRYLLERSSTDRAAAGRVAQSKRDFHEAVRGMDQVLKEK